MSICLIYACITFYCIFSLQYYFYNKNIYRYDNININLLDMFDTVFWLINHQQSCQLFSFCLVLITHSDQKWRRNLIIFEKNCNYFVIWQILSGLPILYIINDILDVYITWKWLIKNDHIFFNYRKINVLALPNILLCNFN